MGANKKISDLTSGSAIGGTEELPIVQSGSTVKTTINTIKTFFDSIYTTTSAVATTLLGYVKKGTLTTNYIPKATASDTIGDSNIYDDGTNVGIGTTSVSAKLQVTGIDATQSNYALKVDNSASSPLLYVRNDGNVGVGEANPIVKLQVNGSLYNNGGRFGDVVIGTYPYVSGLSNEIQGNPLIFNYTGGFDAGVGTNSPTAKFHIKGSGLTSATYALKVDNYGTSPLLYVRNDGIVNIGGLTPSQIVETDASKNLVSAAKGTAYNKNFGTGTNNIVEIGSTLGNTKPLITSSSGKLQTSDWTNIVSSCTFVGWSSYTTQEVDVIDMGTYYNLHIYVAGTSNSTTTTIQLPYTTLSTNNGCGLFTNNGTSLFGRWVFLNGGNTITFTTSATGGAWTNSGTKGVGIDIFFKK